jgi:hypothetical protein
VTIRCVLLGWECNRDVPARKHRAGGSCWADEYVGLGGGERELAVSFREISQS